MWYVAHGYFAYVNKTSFAYPEHLVHEGVADMPPSVQLFPGARVHYIHHRCNIWHHVLHFTASTYASRTDCRVSNPSSKSLWNDRRHIQHITFRDLTFIIGGGIGNPSSHGKFLSTPIRQNRSPQILALSRANHQRLNRHIIFRRPSYWTHVFVDPLFGPYKFFIHPILSTSHALQ